MKGLLLKDFYTLIKQLKFFLLIILFMALIPNTSMAPFAIIYAVMLPVSILGYDERSKWDRYAAMLPYSRKNIVLSKYVIGYLGLTMSSLLTITAKVVYDHVKGNTLEPGYFYEIGALVCFALLFLSINLPFMYKFGVEKGRLAFLALTAVMVFGIMFLADRIEKGSILGSFDGIEYIVPLVVILANVISILVSIRIYEKKEF